jgi:hypothetical protein
MKMACIACRFPLVGWIDLLIERMPTKNDPLAAVNGRRIIARRSCSNVFDCSQAMSRARYDQPIFRCCYTEISLEKQKWRKICATFAAVETKTGNQLAPCRRTEQKSRQVIILQKRPPAKYSRRKIGRTSKVAYPRAFFRSAQKLCSAHTLPFSS